MSSQIPLSPRTLEYLQGLPAHERAQHLLTGLAADGPLDASSAYSAEIATLAHFLWLAWTRGWTQGSTPMPRLSKRCLPTCGVKTGFPSKCCWLRSTAGASQAQSQAQRGLLN